ncbi:MAG TPA: protein kinase [Anaerolineaceae bacterium]|nr:protein kinase [Anaerolineaceae bacterium]HPN53885.1 protein kinase [Anaerolineaceae bacterium]
MADLSGHDIGRYHLIQKLGEGGMAVVYKAYDSRLEREVAIKFIRTEQVPPAMLEKMLLRFEREAKALAKMKHLHIINVFDYGEHQGAPFLVMDFMPGGTLKARTGKPIPWVEVVRLLLPIASALEYAHRQGIVHRDVKPANILITSEGEPMLSDFGIARMLESESGNTLTGTGVGIGTPEYMAPEQWSGSAAPSVDIYALGVVMYELITGRVPYQADTPVAILIKQANDPLPRPGIFVPGLPEAVEFVLFKALAKKPEERFPDMLAFINALDRLAAIGSQTAAAIPLHPQKPPAASTIDMRGDPFRTEVTPVPTGPVTPLPPQRTTPLPAAYAPQPSTPQSASSTKSSLQSNARWFILGGALIILCFCLSIGAWLAAEGSAGRGPLAVMAPPTITPLPTSTSLPPTFTPKPLLSTPTRIRINSNTPAPSSTPTLANLLAPVAGIWSGAIVLENSNEVSAIELTIGDGCKPGEMCGAFSYPPLPCLGNLWFDSYADNYFVFIEEDMSGECVSGGIQKLQLLADGSLSFRKVLTMADKSQLIFNGILNKGPLPTATPTLEPTATLAPTLTRTRVPYTPPTATPVRSNPEPTSGPGPGPEASPTPPPP